MRRPVARCCTLAAAAGAVVLGGGCYEIAFFYPSGGHGSPVTDGHNLGIASRLTGEGADGTEGQAYVVLSVGDAYTADAAEDPAGSAGLRTIIRIVASVVNETKSPARFEARDARLEVAGQVFKPKWTYRSPEAGRDAVKDGTEDPAEEKGEGEEEAFATVAPGSVARYDVYFDLGVYTPPSMRRPDAVAPGPALGIPLRTIREIKLSWKGSWGGEKRSGEARFVRDWSGGYPVTAGPYWGGGWYAWADPWPLGGLIFTTRFGGIGVRSPLLKR
jgi:hypothetical protein